MYIRGIGHAYVVLFIFIGLEIQVLYIPKSSGFVEHKGIKKIQINIIIIIKKEKIELDTLKKLLFNVIPPLIVALI